MTAATETERRRRFDPTRDAKRFVYLLDEDIGVLFEVVGVRGSPRAQQPAANAAVKLLDVSVNLPEDPFEMLDSASWLPIEEAICLAVVVPMPHTEG